MFLPTISPKLNLIEVRWMWMQRQAINNSTLEIEQNIDKAVSDCIINYNKKHVGKMNINSLHEPSIFMFT